MFVLFLLYCAQQTKPAGKACIKSYSNLLTIDRLNTVRSKSHLIVQVLI